MHCPNHLLKNTKACKGIPKTVWSQSWGCFLSVLASISLMQIMEVSWSHQHRLTKRFISSGKCNYQWANRITHHLCCQWIISQVYVGKWIIFCQLSDLSVLSHRLFFWKNALCNVKGQHHIMYENAIACKHTPTLMLFFPPDCLAISRWFHHLNIGLIIAPTELFFKKCCFCTNSSAVKTF